MEETDEQVAERVQGGDADAFGILIDRYEDKLRRYARRFLARLGKQGRGRIDQIDQELIDVLHHRMQIVHQIGDLKIKNNVTAVQIARMNDIMDRRTEHGQKLGLRPEYIQEIWRFIHEESVKTQTDLMRAHHGLDHTDTN